MKKRLILALGAVLVMMVFAAAVYAAVVNGPAAGKQNGPADQQSGSLFENWTGKASTERFYGDVIDVRGWLYATICWGGITKFSNYTGLQGSFTLYGSKNPTGPWAPIYVSTTKQTFTADGCITIPVAVNYIAVSFNRTRNGAFAHFTVRQAK